MTALILIEAVLLVGSLVAGFATVLRIKKRRAAKALRQHVTA
jgi:hypothetical protein